MLNADCAPYFETCPRCGDGGLQRFATHSYCVGCNYSNVYSQVEDLPIPQWAHDALKAASKKSKNSKLNLVPKIITEPKHDTVPRTPSSNCQSNEEAS
ncbi:MAG: hypothetical protein B7Y39_00735 [Bdellovibrio sp. 28-41-41]|nr:MAG: hypothetical protein B7Y39_00735 [Bdellovibrio sp. 28-41-41]